MRWIVIALALAWSPAIAQDQVFTDGPWEARCLINKLRDTMNCSLSVSVLFNSRPSSGMFVMIDPWHPYVAVGGRLIYGGARPDNLAAFDCEGGPCQSRDADAVQFIKDIESAKELLLVGSNALGTFNVKVSLDGYRRVRGKANDWLAKNQPKKP